MADTKITALTALTAADPANDVIPIVDVSDTTMAASGTTKKISVNNILGASGTATLASATITGAATVGTTLGVTGSVSAGNLNVTNSPIPANGVYLSGTNTLAISTASTLRATLTATGLGLATAPASALSFPIGTVTAVGMTAATAHLAGNVSTLKYGVLDGRSDFGGLHVFNTHDGTYSSTEVGLFTGEGGVSVATQRMRIEKTGNVGIGVTPGAAGGCLQLKSGITFPATQVASANANTLDDYEEGTWTPTLTFVTPGTLAVTYSQQTGNYTRVGNLVTARYAITINIGGLVIGTASGGLNITGLPFAVSGVGNQYVDLSASLTDQTSGSLVISYPSTTLINFEQTNVSGTRIVRAGALVSASDFAAVNTGVISLRAVVTYTV